MKDKRSRIILFRGMPGVGKTYISDFFASKNSLIILRKDDVYDTVSELLPTHTERNIASYNVLYKILETNLKSQVDLILDYPFKEHEYLEKLEKIIHNENGVLKSILCECNDEKLWEKRFNKRAENPLPNQLITNFNDLKAHYGNLKLKKYKNELVIDSQFDIELLYKQISSYLNE